MVYGDHGEDVVQQSCLLAMERYKGLENVNQSLFKTLMRESFRKISSHTKFENSTTAMGIDVEDFSNNKLTDYSKIGRDIDVERYLNQVKGSKIREKRIKKMYQSKLTPILPIFLSA